MLRIHLFGELRVELDGRFLEPPAGRRARSLLAWLALHPGLHPRSRVAAVFWPDVLETSARASLRTALSAVRSWLGDGSGCLVATRELIGLEGNDLWVDARALDELLASGRLAEAVELCRGELLAQLDDDWAYEARRRCGDRVADAVAQLADEAEAAGDRPGAAAWTRRLVELEPLSESAHRLLVARLAAAGEPAEALAAYEAMRERLRRELGVVPSPETRTLVDEIRRGELPRPVAGPEPGRRPLPAAFARPEPIPLVGREQELERLLTAWRGARSGRLRLVLLAGEAGTGKSRLAAELARRVHASGATVALGRCLEENVVPYGPFQEIVRHLLDGASTTGFPLAETASASDDPEGARYRLFEEVAEQLAETAAEAPLLLVVEDVHWADRPTLLLLAHVARAAAHSPLLVLATFREGEGPVPATLASLLGDLRRADAYERVTIEGLDAPHVAELVSAWLGADVPAELALAVRRLTGGNPLFVGELAGRLGEIARPEAGGADWRDAIAAAGLPEGVGDVIGQRIARLSDPAREVVTAGAIVGERFRLEEAAALTELEGSDLVDALDEMLDARLIREEPGSPGRYAFPHALVREAALARLSATRRSYLHGRAAEAFERLYVHDLDPHLAELARHATAALPSGDPARAAEYARRAAARAIELLAYEDAAEHAERALRALDGRALPEAARVELLLALGEGQLRAGEVSASRDAFARAAAGAIAAGSTDQLARAALGHCGLGITLVAVREDTVRLLEQALERLDEDHPLRPRVLARLAIELYYDPSPERRETLSEEAVRAARRLGDARALLEALNARRVALWSPDHLEERLSLGAELIELARRADDREKELQGLNWRVVDVLETGDLDGAMEAAHAHQALADELRLPGYRWYGSVWQAMVAVLRGRFDEAAGQAAAALELGRAAQDENADLFHVVQSQAIRFERGAVSADDLAFIAARAEISPATAAWLAWLALFDLVRGDRGTAAGRLARIASAGFAGLPRDANLLVSLSLLSMTAAELSDREAADELYELLLPYADRCVVVGRAIRCGGSVAYPLGLLAACLDRRSAGAEHFEHALEVHRRLDARPLLARTKLAYAELLERGSGSDARRAAALRSEALALARELGMQKVAARARSPGAETG